MHENDGYLYMQYIVAKDIKSAYGTLKSIVWFDEDTTSQRNTKRNKCAHERISKTQLKK